MDHARVVKLIAEDFARTIGSSYDPIADEAAARIRLFTGDPDDFEQRVVDDVQQYIHDSLIDTSWPRCPEHPHHPIWYSDGWWSCETTGKRIARLGKLFAENEGR